MLRKTKIVCTLGPASDSEEMISKLMDAGMNVCRLNMSHGSYEEQGARIDRIKRLRKEKNIPVAIMLDTKGPEVRTKTLKDEKVTLEAGKEFILTSRDIEGDETQVSITYPKMVSLRSFSPIDGICRSTSGTEMPLRLPSTPPLVTEQTISVPFSMRLTCIASKPSSISTRVPG